MSRAGARERSRWHESRTVAAGLVLAVWWTAVGVLLDELVRAWVAQQ